MKRRALANHSCTHAFERLEQRCLMSATPMTDPSFGVDGVAYPGVTTFSPDPEPAVALEPDGKIVIADLGNAAGQATDMYVMRLNANGTFDATYGGPQGAVLDSAWPSADLVQSDGKILLAVVTAPFDTQGSLIRLNADGSVDTTFGTGGRIEVPAKVTAIAQGADGSLFVGGPGTGDSLIVMHLGQDGSLDAGFGNAGVVSFTAVTGDFNNYGATKLLPTPDGKLVVVGSEMGTNASVGSQCLLARIGADGTMDPSFNGGQAVLGTRSATFSALADADLLPDSSILIASRDQNTLTLARYGFDGSPDSSFGSGGLVTDSVGNNFMGGPLKIMVRNTGEIVVEGFGTEHVYIGHFTPGGQLLESQTTSAYMPGVGGTSPTEIPPGLAVWQSNAAAIDSQGDVIAAGNTARKNGGGWVYPLAVVRLEPDDYVWSGDPSFRWDPYPEGPPAQPTNSVSGARSDLRSARKALVNDVADLRARLHADVIALRSARRGHDTLTERAALRLKIKDDRGGIGAQRRSDLSAVVAARRKLRDALRSSRAQ
jgi:uncharacterized delta-60 repeat protein